MIDARIPVQGVFATRSQRRPSPVGVTVVRLLRRRGNVLWVSGLDAIDETPVLDMKPYFPNHDAYPSATLPEWARTLDQESSD
jgi:tRNA (Thr-GGU) A37 N-methylase